MRRSTFANSLTNSQDDREGRYVSQSKVLSGSWVEPHIEMVQDRFDCVLVLGNHTIEALFQILIALAYGHRHRKQILLRSSGRASVWNPGHHQVRIIT